MNTITNSATNGVAGFIEDLTLISIPPWWQNPWIMLVLLISLATLVMASRRLYLRWQLKAAQKPPAPVAPGEPPHLEALRRLEELRGQIDQLGAYKLSIECSLVLRRYIEARFKLRVIYQTTREFLGHAQTHEALNQEQRGGLGKYLEFCDKVKFARQSATLEEMVQLLDYAVAFVKACATPVPA